jgi:acyl-CoA reductase-like NAD-dependent aldehyde dehydrogenase
VSGAAHWIGGAPARFAGETEREVRSPWSGEAVGAVPIGSPAAVEAAVAAAQGAWPAWRRTPLAERSERLEALAARIEANGEELAALLVAEVGKPIRGARLEVRNLLAALRWFCAEAPRQIHHDALPARDGFTPLVRRDPVGVVAAITPFNFPVQLLAWKLGPALLAGCPLVCKPDPRTPLSTALLAQWANELGFPPGVFSVLHGDGATGAALVEHPGVAKVAFTGSATAGRAVYRSAADGIKRVTLELGGCSALVVDADADLARWLPAVLNRAFYNAGQYCFRVNRALVHERRYAEFVEGFAKAAAELAVGDPADERTDVGPLIDRPSFERVLERIEDAERRGARVRLDGRAHARAGRSLLGPTLLCDVPDDALVMRDETFGPVVSAAPVRGVDEAVARANASPYGLAAFALTGDPRTGARLAEELEAGTVWVNALDQTLLELPFGGVKQSGIGIEKSARAFDEYLLPRAVYFGFPTGSGF